MDQARDLADRILKSLNPTLGLPCPSTVLRNPGNGCGGALGLAEVGTLQLELRELSALTQDMKCVSIRSWPINLLYADTPRPRIVCTVGLIVRHKQRRACSESRSVLDAEYDTVNTFVSVCCQVNANTGAVSGEARV